MLNRSRSREDLKNIILMNLGHPINQVNVTDAQIQNCIDTAMKQVWRWHYDATFESAYTFRPTEEDVKNGYIILPDQVESVIEVIHGTEIFGNGNFASAEWQMMASVTMSSNRFLPISLVDYVGAQQRILNTKQVLRGNPHFHYVHAQRRLIFKFKVQTDRPYALRTIERVDPELTEPNRVDSSLFFDNETLKELSTALVKQTWGMNLRKFQGMTLPGDITVDGDSLYREGKEEEATCLQRLKDEAVDMIYIF
ncbi:gp13 neck protein [Delftia phage PhiW-14]|uniref:Gp13 neck protein n=1 Tax=Delftia phage PhiW-14 TaxID=665032 RepID=C9DG22_BPW14|nr:gp13 neck protein [Delftia phage PhiW-14]ACV50073.1 gp13 neck protein [Delftia phage PhiW-14]